MVLARASMRRKIDYAAEMQRVGGLIGKPLKNGADERT